MSANDTIVALSTPQGVGAIGVIRLSGPEAFSVVAEHLGAWITEAEANTVHFGRFTTGDKVLDEVVATVFRAPRSYTGEDVIELSFHGSHFILNEALSALLTSGARLANPGEFTQRAFLNGKLDLSQAEAVADLIASESEAEHRLAMHQMRGGFSKEIAQLREELIHFASLIELELDFSEEDVEFANRDELVELVRTIQGFVQRLIDSFRFGNAIKQGVPVAIIGKPNAGKSTLLNHLLNEDRAIVSDIPGTTRDAIEDIAVIEGIRFRFIDTAGIRETEDIIESMGVKKSLEKMKSASVVLYLFDAVEPWDIHQKSIVGLIEELDQTQAEVIPVANKTDLLAADTSFHEAVVPISAKSGVGIEALIQTILSRINTTGAGRGDVVVTNARHLHALKATDEALKQSLHAIESGLSGDLIAADIREALHHLGSITGDITTDDLLGNIFGKFCIGK
ncbi:MAG: tRNA uridine-5-carboxymethylaminomethyl(34) synthesis GTPase MnmE [Flavobacteriales bacterium]|nr:tRNA uridine-5-carboxymethylaminomethyl(34) synthesis GTPase MnmE [Flavobacteriales bacterium]